MDPTYQSSQVPGMVVGTNDAAPTVVANPSLDAPLMMSQADLRWHLWGGVPHRVTLTLFNDRIAVVRVKDGQTLLDVPLTELQKVKRGSDLISFRAQGKRYTFEFALLKEKMSNSLIGGVAGGAAGAAGSVATLIAHTADAKAWQDALVTRGVLVGKAWI